MKDEWALLAAKAQAGDGAAYGDLLRAVLVPLRAYVARRVRQEDWREDVVQEILMSIHRAFPTYRPGEPFEPWMYSVARYRVVDYFRRRGRTLAREELRGDFATDAAGVASTADATPADAPFTDELAAALGALPERQRRAVLLLKQEDLSVRDAAARMGVTESSLKVLAHRGYKALKTLLMKGNTP